MEASEMLRYVSLVVVIMAMVALIGCPKPTETTPPTTPTVKTETTKEAPAKTYKIAVVPKGTAYSFWKTVKAGADAAGKEVGAEIDWKGPAEETDIARQIGIIENFITAKVDGIVMAACDAKALVPKVKAAQEAGIPVITIDSGIATDDALSFVATDNVKGARQGTERLIELIGGEGQIGCIPFIKGAATSDMREQGFNEAVKANPKVQAVKPLWSEGDAAKAMKAAENMMTSNPELKGIFAANEPGAIGAAQAIKQRKMTGKIKLVAFDAADAEINALKEGTIQALVVQDPFKMGYDGVKLVVDAIQGKTVEKRVDTGVTVVTMDNFNDPGVQKLLYPKIEE
ncbi:MAG: substrate-binding domain-containing protein [Armatimonadetes bacterium]|nr:substrate-binding domain-containing protein [Armatimonadota bacterium]